MFSIGFLFLSSQYFILPRSIRFRVPYLFPPYPPKPALPQAELSAVEGPGAWLISLLPTPQPPTHLPGAFIWPLSSVLAPWRVGRLGDVARFLGEQGSPSVLGQLELWGLGPYTVAWPGAGRSDQRAWRSGPPTLPSASKSTHF